MPELFYYDGPEPPNWVKVLEEVDHESGEKYLARCLEGGWWWLHNVDDATISRGHDWALAAGTADSALRVCVPGSPPEYVYRVVDKNGRPLRTRQSQSHEAFYAQAGTAKAIATRANKSGASYGEPGSPAGAPYSVQRAAVVWEDV